VLQRRLTGALAAAIALAVLAGCGDKPIEDNLVRPGITALDEARSEACGANASAVRTAIDAYTMLEGEPPPDEQALVDGEFLRETTTDWDVVDGELVAENPACGPVGEAATPPTVVDITTDAVPMSADEILAEMTDEQVSQVGGVDCAGELADIFSAAERFVADLGREPEGFDDLVDEGYLDTLPALWVTDGDELRPAGDGPCLDLG
jgi:hypothetical protein